MDFAVRRNFGGVREGDPVAVFRNAVNLPHSSHHAHPPECSISELLRSSLSTSRMSQKSTSGHRMDENRYLLLLTENLSALHILRQKYLSNDDPVIMFGSSFPKDQQYTHICRSINRIKVCMATGRTLVLLNLEKLYESLYDVLNQYYVIHGRRRWVDLGLGSDRLKCQVHESFKIIMIAERDDVYSNYPIPLINRMEKHFLAMSSMLNEDEASITATLNNWAIAFSNITSLEQEQHSHSEAHFTVSDSFVGYHSDLPATIVKSIASSATHVGTAMTERRDDADKWRQSIFHECVERLLQMATPDAVARVHRSELRVEADHLWKIYFAHQQHSSLTQYLMSLFVHGCLEDTEGLLIQVTTRSKLMSTNQINDLERSIGRTVESVALQQFDTEHQFCRKIRTFYTKTSSDVLLVQCLSKDANTELLSCARHIVEEERRAHSKERRVHSEPRGVVVFVVHLSTEVSSSYRSFQGAAWKELHIDDLQPAGQTRGLSETSAVNTTVSSLLDFSPEDLGQASTEERHDGSHLNDSENVSESKVREKDTGHTVNVVTVLRDCVHDAVSKLEDTQRSVEMIAKRISVLLSLIADKENSDSPAAQFTAGVRRRVVKLLREGESRAGVESATQWVKRTALNPTAVRESGTFRHALWLRVLELVIPILAEVIAYVDVDSNLKLLRDVIDENRQWLVRLWLSLFSCSAATHLSYRDFSPVLARQLRPRVPVPSSGLENHHYHARFPFSCRIKAYLDDLMVEAQRSPGRDLQRVLR